MTDDLKELQFYLMKAKAYLAAIYLASLNLAKHTLQ
jgi:hypothetical protein